MKTIWVQMDSIAKLFIFHYKNIKDLVLQIEKHEDLAEEVDLWEHIAEYNVNKNHYKEIDEDNIFDNISDISYGGIEELVLPQPKRLLKQLKKIDNMEAFEEGIQLSQINGDKVSLGTEWDKVFEIIEGWSK